MCKNSRAKRLMGNADEVRDGCSAGSKSERYLVPVVPVAEIAEPLRGQYWAQRVRTLPHIPMRLGFGHKAIPRV